ncbi:MAG: hypothetical protein ACKVZH_16255, partial [Blastocatellia bacterium]
MVAELVLEFVSELAGFACDSDFVRAAQGDQPELMAFATPFSHELPLPLFWQARNCFLLSIPDDTCPMQPDNV